MNGGFLVCFLLLNLKMIHSQYQATLYCCLFEFYLYSPRSQNKMAFETCLLTVHESGNVSEPTYASRLVSQEILWRGKTPSPLRLQERNCGMVVHENLLF